MFILFPPESLGRAMPGKSECGRWPCRGGQNTLLTGRSQLGLSLPSTPSFAVIFSAWTRSGLLQSPWPTPSLRVLALPDSPHSVYRLSTQIHHAHRPRHTDIY